MVVPVFVGEAALAVEIAASDAAITSRVRIESLVIFNSYSAGD